MSTEKRSSRPPHETRLVPKHRGVWTVLLNVDCVTQMRFYLTRPLILQYICVNRVSRNVLAFGVLIVSRWLAMQGEQFGGPKNVPQCKDNRRYFLSDLNNTRFVGTRLGRHVERHSP